ncbi:tubulin-like doman-containing protein [Gorillibacterium massiliense]|uniref:tubulin-like doman-containing protein n=1 Tax=Gorillibacterium massiliense TaxID=1280390 RepID=UPI0004B1F9A3|nr:tubulin-like doman-containing protein [Gorillibacterium massiliense]
MKAIVREHIQQMDVSLGGGIISEKIRVDTIDNPMLVIGLGGTGIDALLRLKYQINRRFKLPNDPLSKKKREKPDNIEYIGFETNEGELQKKYKGIGLDPLTEFVLLSNAEIGSLLQNRKVLEPYITEWLSPELLVTDGVGGASGNRQTGRLLLFTKILQVVQTIEKKIKTLTEGTNKKLMVFLLTGLSGGTGSGGFLDIAYIIRGLMEREYAEAGVDKVSMLGYLFMPDVNLSNKSLTDHTREYIKKNGYAALKELDYWMNADERGERFRQRYGNVLTVNSPLPPFNLAHLISATNLDGKLLENAYDYCMNVTAENITNFMAMEEKQSGEEFAIHDYISNIRSNINQMAKPYAANYQYNIIGASSAVLPIEEMTTYLAYCLFQKMETMFKVGPSREDVEKFAHKLGIDPDAIHREFLKRVPEPLPGYENSERLSHQSVIKLQVVNMDTELEMNFLSRAREEYIKARRQLPGELLERFIEQIERVFLNPEQGPFYANRIIYTAKGPSLLALIQSYIESLKETLHRMPDDIEAAKDNAEQKLGDARDAFISKEKRKNLYIDAKIQEYQLLSDRERFEQMIDFYEDLYRVINEQNSRIYEVFAELLNALNVIFEKNGAILARGDEDVDHRGNRTYYWNIVNVPDVERVIGNILDEKNVQTLIRDFTAELMARSSSWIKEAEVDIVGSISEFMTDQFGDLITKSMEDFLLIKYGKDESIENIMERIIAKRLNEEAVPVFHLSNSSGSFHFPSYGFVSVPVKAPNIYKGIKNFEAHAVGNARFTVKESEVKNRIFWLNTKNGVPLFSYAPLKSYEESYEKTILQAEGNGRHLVQSEKVNWVNLPSPIPEMSWGDTYENVRVKAYNAEVRGAFAEAENYRIIREKNVDSRTTSRFECVFGVPFDPDAFAARYNMQLDLPKPNLGEVKKAIAGLKELLAGGLEKETVRDIFNSTDREQAMESLIRYPDLFDSVRRENAKYGRIAAEIARYERILAKFQDEEHLLGLFIEAMYTGTIVKKGAQYVYDVDAEEESWEPFVNLLRANKFTDYAIYDKLRSLDPKKAAQVERKAAKRSEKLTSDENITPLIAQLESMVAAYQEAKGSLDYDREELVNGEEMYRFYRQAVIKVNDMLSTLR